MLQSNAYGMKESGPSGGDMNAWTSAGLQTTAGYYPYDPALAAYGWVTICVIIQKLNSISVDVLFKDFFNNNKIDKS